MLVYEPNLQFRTFILVGCGGTGSRIASMLTQFVASTCNHPTIKPLIVFIDDDVVEPKNLARQLFSSADVGEYKAESLARRYSSAFGITIVPIVARVKSPLFYPGESIRDVIIQELTYRGLATTEEAAQRMLEKPTILITAVDSIEARRDIIAGWCASPARDGRGSVSPMLHLASTVVIDPGNAAITGQVSVFNPVIWPSSGSDEDWRETRYSVGGASNNGGSVMSLPAITEVLPERLGAEQRISTIPMPWTRYLKSKGSVGAPSCADLDQTLAVNSLVATASFTIVQNLIFGVPLRSLTAYFSIDLDNHTKKMTYPWLREVLTGKDADYFTVASLREWGEKVVNALPEESNAKSVKSCLATFFRVAIDKKMDNPDLISQIIYQVQDAVWDDMGHGGVITRGQMSMLAFLPRRLNPNHLFWVKEDPDGGIPGTLRGFLNTYDFNLDSLLRKRLGQYIQTGKWGIEEPAAEPEEVTAAPAAPVDTFEEMMAPDEGVPLAEVDPEFSLSA